MWLGGRNPLTSDVGSLARREGFEHTLGPRPPRWPAVVSSPLDRLR
jgi:hypothetical protein